MTANVLRVAEILDVTYLIYLIVPYGLNRKNRLYLRQIVFGSGKYRDSRAWEGYLRR